MNKYKAANVILIILLIISTGILYIKNSNISVEKHHIQNSIDSIFIFRLREAATYLSTPFEGSPEEMALYRYEESLSNIAAAKHMATLTTYNRDNSDLSGCLIQLHYVMLSPTYREQIKEYRQELFKYIGDLGEDPRSVETINNIMEIVNTVKDGR